MDKLKIGIHIFTWNCKKTGVSRTVRSTHILLVTEVSMELDFLHGDSEVPQRIEEES